MCVCVCVEWRCEVFNPQKSFTRSKSEAVDCIATHNNRISGCVYVHLHYAHSLCVCSFIVYYTLSTAQCIHVCVGFCVPACMCLQSDFMCLSIRLIAICSSFMSVSLFSRLSYSSSLSIIWFVPSDRRELCVYPEELVVPSGCRDVSQSAGGVRGAGRSVM